MKIRKTRILISVIAVLIALAFLATDSGSLASALEGYTSDAPPDSNPQGLDSNTDGGRDPGPDLTDLTPINEVYDSRVLPVQNPYNLLQFGYDQQHSLNDTLETTITTANVANLHAAFKITLPSVADGTPVYLGGVSTPSGTHDLLFVTTLAGHIVALDAHTGAQIWMQQYPAGSCTFGINPVPCYMQSAPAIDPNLQYVYAYGLDGTIHKYQVGTGTEVTGGGWPEPTTAKNFEKVSTDLSFGTNSSGTTFLYMGHSGKTDYGDYQGHLTTVNLATGTQHVFNLVCSNMIDIYFLLSPGTPDCPKTKSGLWSRTAGAYSSATGRVYLTVGNGSFSPSKYYWAFTTMALNPDGTSNAGNPLDSYTPSNWSNMATLDQDETSTPAMLPAPSGSIYPHLGTVAGKDSIVRLLNLDNMSGQGGPGHTGGELQAIAMPQGYEVYGTPAVWVNRADGSTWVFYTCRTSSNGGTTAFKLVVNSSGVPSLQSEWSSTKGWTSPVVADNILFVATSKLIQALDPTTGTQLWSTTGIGTIHWESPVIVNGMLYMTDQASHLTAFMP